MTFLGVDERKESNVRYEDRQSRIDCLHMELMEMTNPLPADSVDRLGDPEEVMKALEARRKRWEEMSDLQDLQKPIFGSRMRT